MTTVTATDPDAGTTLTYSISGGADAAKFGINSSTGVLTFVSAPNFEAPTDAGSNNVYDVTVQASDGSANDTQAIAVTVTNVNFTITASAGLNGSIDPAGAVGVDYGANESFTVTPELGYHVADVLVDGVSVGAVVSYDFTDVAADRSIAASFAIDQFTLTYAAGANGSIVGTSLQTVDYGANGTEVVATPATGYHFVSWSDSYPTAARADLGVIADASVTASFAIDAPATRAIAVTAGLGGSITPSGVSGVVTVGYGATQTFTVTPDANYHVKNFTHDGAPASLTGDQFTCDHTTEDCSVAVTFAPNTPTQYTIRASAGGHGTISPKGDASVAAHANREFTFNPAAGYHVDVVTVEGTPVSGSPTTYTFTDVTDDHTIRVTFARNASTKYTITASAGSHGSISPSGAVKVTYGDNKTFTFNPAAGYHVDVVTVDGTPVLGHPTSYKFTGVIANHTINVSFEADPVSYIWGGFLSPLRDRDSRRFNLGSTVPVKFTLLHPGRPRVTDAIATLVVTGPNGFSLAAPGVFRYQSDGDFYSYDLRTLRSWKSGTYTLRVNLSGSIYSVQITLRKE